jgi:ferric-dicitrate binding protein FerR (iron transport regulator)
VPAQATVFDGDRIATRARTALALALPGGDQVLLPENSAARVRRDGKTIRVALERGALAVVDRGAEPLLVEASGVEIEPAESAAAYEVLLKGAAFSVVARKGAARVRAADRTVEVPEGMTLEATAAQRPAGAGGGLSPLQMAILVASAAAGFTGLALGAAALSRSDPKDCVVVSPDRIRCP